jgi:putative transcriptional regulator
MRNDVRELRKAKGMSQEQLGVELGVSRQTINAVEQERYTPSLPLAIDIAHFFGQTVEEIFHVD